MNQRFLRDEAARFRSMADDNDREASKVRLLAMAADYESRAGIAGDLSATVTEPSQAETTEVVTEPDQGEALKPQIGKKVVGEPRGGSLAGRRPVGRPRLSLPLGDSTSVKR